jgi:hypothetical protein
MTPITCKFTQIIYGYPPSYLLKDSGATLSEIEFEKLQKLMEPNTVWIVIHPPFEDD